ncbi:MAG: Mrp/NBP35 family ATP-binding protein [Candidatus Neomarinimicrobiota bacterium]
MTNEEVMERLKSIKYPGFSRDIVSFGIVKTVEVKGDSVRVVLLMSSASEESQKNIHQRVLSELEGSFSTVDIFLEQKNPAQKPAQTLDMIPEVKHTIAVASGKGGVGKSTVAVNIACELMQRGHSVGLLDLDIYGPSLPILTGINEQPSMTSDKKLIPIEKHGIKLMSFGFLSGNDTPVIWRGPMVARMTEQFFGDVIWGKLDYLILDLPPGTGDIQLTLVQKLKISGAIIVTTPQDLAVSDVRKGADMFAKVHTPVLGVIENMAGYILSGFVRDINGEPLKNGIISFAEKDGSKDFSLGEDGKFSLEIDLFKRGGGKNESERLQVPLLGEVPISQDLMESCDEGIPIVIKDRKSVVSQAFSSILDKIEKVLA